MRIKIRAIEKHLPQICLHSAEMDEIANGKEGRIEKHTGVHTRYHVGKDESVASLGATALKKALAKSNLQVSDIDLLLFCGASYDYPIPHNAAIIKSLIADDSINFHCLDIDSTCLSFLNALEIANMYIETNRYNRIAIVCSEISSRALTPKDELVFGLFGDAAVALIIEKSEKEGYRQTYSKFMNYPSGALYANVPIGGAINRGFENTTADLGYYFQMQGKSLFRLTTKHMDNFIKELETTTKIKFQHFDKVIPHQTSKMGNSYVLNHFGLSKEQIIETLHCYGNCISASIPLGLELFYNEQRKELPQNIVLFGSGAGVSIGALVLCFD
jgi:3-oxoacyl-[acyl-carrier-protein] synthase-3